MQTMHRCFRRLLFALASVVLLTLFAIAQASQAGNLVSYLPAIFGVAAGPPATPGSPTPPLGTATPTATPDPRHFSGCAFRTGNNATVAVTVAVTINGSFTFEVGDEIAIFNPGGTLCAGTTTWSGKNIAITAWGDDTQTAEIDGLLAGEEMKFRIWDKSAAKELVVSAATYSVGTGIYQTDSVHVVGSLTIDGS